MSFLINPYIIGAFVALIATSLIIGSPVLGSPSISQNGIIEAVPLTDSSPVLGSPALTQKHVLVAANYTDNSPVLGVPLMNRKIILDAVDLTVGSPVLGTPDINGVLTAVSLVDSSPVLGSPSVDIEITLIATSFDDSSPVLGVGIFPDYTPGALGTWVPSTVSGLTLWFDYSNSSSITLVSGAISQANDLSGQNLHITQSTAANRPTLVTADQNGLDVASFDGINDRLFKSSGVSPKVPAQTQTTFVISKTSGATGGWIYWTTNGSTVAGVILASSSSTRYQGNTANFASATSSNAYHVFSGYILTTKREAYKDGSLEATNSTTETIATVPTQIHFGSDSNPVSFLTGKVGEFFQYNATLSAQDRQRGEGYLAWKWGTQSLLPSDHPYKLGGPNVP